ncbi:MULTISPECIES: CidA/LrgA family protein [Burkholderia cepacia complex]|uniref:CidA/LrgA family protein n=1 Tax=Burkholderia cenocepacia TaxID=95486 RepID=A0A1V2W211_9BURK|nr:MULTISPECIES: CidA/LrgA family protein [Burkholderia cepacia complex]MBR8250218.1 CidA/LrgA family protein [Burkholderia cenocepacia]MBR8286529.1 CidA/LrgA family protein [Burkholderia cenocepacia]MBR8501971.1 CidA/LrgA family protein [Burkholderia cenocepacia]MDV3101334.1 CidA/LrgA family protein [Burkholderia cenocepacia]ONI99800.1 CidA/LrgA family protein [Burkholderia cenocepacia]
MPLLSIAILLTFQCLGEGITYLLHLSVPGPVVGMLLLLISLHAFPPLATTLESTASNLLQNLSLLFVPAGVGVMATANVVKGDLIPIAISLVVSTLLTVAVTALIMRCLTRVTSERNENHAGDMS